VQIYFILNVKLMLQIRDASGVQQMSVNICSYI